MTAVTADSSTSPPTALLAPALPFAVYADETSSISYSATLVASDGVTPIAPVCDSNGNSPWFRGPDEVDVVFMDFGAGRFPNYAIDSMQGLLQYATRSDVSQHWTAVQYFDANPVFNDETIPIKKVAGLTAALANSQTGGLTLSELSTLMGGDPTNLVIAVNRKASLTAASNYTKIDTAQLPDNIGGSQPLGTGGKVASQAARLALTGKVGDWVIQTDNNTRYDLVALPASTNANWVPMPVTLSPTTAPSGLRFDIYKPWPTSRPAAATGVHFNWRGAGTDYPTGWGTAAFDGDERIFQG